MGLERYVTKTVRFSNGMELKMLVRAHHETLWGFFELWEKDLEKPFATGAVAERWKVALGSVVDEEAKKFLTDD